MHLGVVKDGLLRLAKLEVISWCIISAKTKNSMLDNLSSNFDNPYYRSCYNPVIHIYHQLDVMDNTEYTQYSGFPSANVPIAKLTTITM